MRLMQQLLNKLKEERGAVMVLVAVAGSALLAFLGLTTDVGTAYLTRARLSALADAAALAGARELPGNPAQAVVIAVQYAVANKARSAAVTTEVTHSNRMLTVKASQQVNFIFGSFLGQESGVVAVQASARIDPATGIWNSSPLIMPDNAVRYNVQYKLKGASGDYESPLGSGTFGAISLGGTGASTYRQFLLEGFKDLIQVGNSIDTETGVMSGPTLQAIKERIESCPINCTYQTYIPGSNCSHIINIPLYDAATVINVSGQVKRVQITGFAAFYVAQVGGPGNGNNVLGYFVEDVTSGFGDPMQQDGGLMAVYLVK